MPYLGNEPAVAYTSTTKDSFSGDGSTTDFTMSKSANVNAVRVVVENVVQNPTVAYTCSGTTLSFTSAPPTGTSNIYVVHLGPPAATVAPPTTINNATTFTADLTVDTNTLYVDSTNNRVGLGTSSPNAPTAIVANSSTYEGLELITPTGDGSGEFHIGVHQNGSTSGRSIVFKRGGSDGMDTESMRIDSSGKVGIGTTDPLRQLSIANSASAEMSFISGASSNSSILFGSGLTGVDVYRGYIQYEHSNDAMTFATVAAERMRIDSSGNLAVAKSAVDTDTVGVELRSNGLLASTRNNSQCLFLNRLSSDGTVVSFAQTGSTKGTISISGSSTAYNTSSDYRLKENVTDVTDGITRVKQLSPKRFNFIVDADTTVDGFLAHEAATVVPEAVHGTKDEVEIWADGDELPDGVSVGDNKLDDDGKTIPVMQGIDQAKLVPLLTAALQEAITKIEALETKVAALEAG